MNRNQKRPAARALGTTGGTFHLNTPNYTMRPKQNPITESQQQKLVRLIVKVGKATYQQAKSELGIAPETTIQRLTKRQASRLIVETEAGQ